MECFHNAEKQRRAKPTDMFNDVYDQLPANLMRQRDEMVEHLKKYKSE
jgi:hypothetical protein